jgi:uncharacterized protein YciI
MHYLLMYDVVENYTAARTPFRKLHLLHATAAYERGELVLGGALANPSSPAGPGARLGAVIVFKGDSPEVAEEFAKADPYVLNGVVTSWRVHEWTTVVGDQASVKVDPNSL